MASDELLSVACAKWSQGTALEAFIHSAHGQQAADYRLIPFLAIVLEEVDSSSSLTAAHLRLDDPRAVCTDLGATIRTRYRASAVDLRLTITAPPAARASLLAKQKASVPCRVTALARDGEKAEEIGVFTATLVRDQRAANKLWSFVGPRLVQPEPLVEIPIPVPGYGPGCIGVWRYSTLNDWFYTTCYGDCIPKLLDCLCYSVNTKALQVQCWHWVPCFCGPI